MLESMSNRYFWSLIYLILVLSTIFTVLQLWQRFSNNPTVTNLASSNYEVWNVPFPAIAVCSINKISKAKAKELAEKIAEFTQLNTTLILYYLKLVSKLHDFDFDASKIDEFLAFQRILDRMDINIVQLMRSLSTPCQDLLTYCQWKGYQRDCNTMFQLRLTFEGYCCIFNYVKLTDEMDFENHSEEIEFTEEGIEKGLYLEVSNIFEDYFYTLLSSAGIKIYIFYSKNYPDRTSGALTTVLSQPDFENFLEIDPVTITAVSDIRNYRPEHRNCVFNDESKTKFSGVYSQSDCFSSCKAESILAMCQCVPFMLPFSSANDVCTLADIACLNKYNDKWTSFCPDTNIKGLQVERQNSLRCEPPCFSNCEETIYNVYVTSFPMIKQDHVKANSTIFYIYFSERYSKLYQQDVVYYWFEILSNFGGMCGLILGVSLISVSRNIVQFVRNVITKLLM